MSNVCVVLMTAPDEASAVSIVQTVVGERLAACGNLLPGIRSIYRWNDEVCDDPEVLVVFKTSEATFGDLKARIVALHPYDCPEVISIGVKDGHADYLSWVLQQSR